MIGNNACGPRALGYGRSVGQRGGPRRRDRARRAAAPRARPGRARSRPASRRLRDVVAGDLGTIRTEFGTFGRQVSGYSLEHLLPERGFDVARFLAGTEGTLAVITGATVRLVADAPHKQLVALGYADHGRRRRRGHWPSWRTDRPPSRASTGASSTSSGAGAATPPCRRCRAATASCSSRSSATTRARWPPARRGCWPTPARSTASRSPTRPRRSRCGRSARTAPAWPASASPNPPTPAGRTRPCRRPGSGRTCATSTPCSPSSGSTRCRTGTSATAACTPGSTSR